MNEISRGAITELLEGAERALRYLESPDPDMPGATREGTGRNNDGKAAARSLRQAISRLQTALAAPGPPAPQDDDTTRAARAAVKLLNGMGLADTIRDRLLDGLDVYHGTRRVTITADLVGGRIEHVNGLPPGVTLRVLDYDTDGVDPNDLCRPGPNGKPFVLSEWTGPAD